MLLARWITGAFGAVTLVPGFELRFSLSPDWRIAALTAGLALIAALVATVGPALAVTAGDLLPSLKEGGGSIGGRRTAKLRAAIVIAQVAVAALASVAAGLLVKSGRAASAVALGFQTGRTFATDLDLAVRGYTDERGRAFYRSLLARAAAIPGVEAVALANRAPLDSSTPSVRVVRDDEGGAALADRETGLETTFYSVSGEYFSAIGISLVAGRTLATGDTTRAPRVAVINETLAERLWPDQHPQTIVGRRLRSLSATSAAREPSGVIEVGGVARNAKYRTVGEDPQPHVYFPFEQQYSPDLTLIVRSASSAMPVIETQAAIASLDPEVQGFFTRTLEEHTRIALVPARFAATVSAVVGLVSALLGAIGLYALIACIVAERRREFGVYLALGATPFAVSRQVLRQALTLAAIGCIVGLGGALMAMRLLTTLLYGVSTADPAVYGLVAAGVLTVALTASWLPARRAARIDPLAALRDG